MTTDLCSDVKVSRIEEKPVDDRDRGKTKKHADINLVTCIDSRLLKLAVSVKARFNSDRCRLAVFGASVIRLGTSTRQLDFIQGKTNFPDFIFNLSFKNHPLVSFIFQYIQITLL